MTSHVDLGWTLDDVAEATSGMVFGDPTVTVSRISTDSREHGDRSLFVAISGERFDGHDFIDAARAAGCVAALVESGRGIGAEPRVEVVDVSQALLDLATKRRSELHMPVVAITGSTGKTSTKDLLAAGIRGSWASPRSFNNEVGVPITVLSTPDDATALVLEVGSRGPGHIRWLTPAVAPDVSIVTNLGVVHLETFGSEEGLADAKYELIGMLGSSGVAVVPDNEPRLRRGGPATEITFGQGSGDVSVGEVELDAHGRPTFRLDTPQGPLDIALTVAGRHQAMNAAAAIAGAHALGLDLDQVAAAMQSTDGSAWRMDVHEGTYTVVNDAYNANPQSVAAALETVAAMGGNKRIAVLGPMAELGSVCEREHAAMGERARALGFAQVIVIGPDHGYVLGAGDLVSNATGLEEAADTLHAVIEPGDVVLVKASRAAGLERLALDLAQDAAR